MPPTKTPAVEKTDTNASVTQLLTILPNDLLPQKTKQSTCTTIYYGPYYMVYILCEVTHIRST